MKQEVKMLAPPRAHYLFCLRNLNNQSRRMAWYQFIPMMLFSYELCFFAIVVMDGIFCVFWSEIYYESILLFNKYFNITRDKDGQRAAIVDLVLFTNKFIQVQFGFIEPPEDMTGTPKRKMLDRNMQII